MSLKGDYAAYQILPDRTACVSLEERNEVKEGVHKQRDVRCVFLHTHHSLVTRRWLRSDDG